LKNFKQHLNDVKTDPLHHTESGKLASHIHKVYGIGKKYNFSPKGGNFSTHTVDLSKETKEKLGQDLKNAGWHYEKETNPAGDVAHRFTHPTEKHTTVVHVDHNPKGINSHLSDHVVTYSRNKSEPTRSHYYD
jgi:hypothetical protein